MAITAPNYGAIYKQSLAQAQKTYAPTIAAEEAKSKSLTDRYNATIEQLRGQETQNITDVERTSTQEFGRRGILGGGIVGSTLTQRINPIRQQFAGLFSQTAADREASIADLASRVAGYKTQQSNLALQTAQNLYGTKYGSYENALQRQFQAQQAALDRANKLKTTGTGGTPTIITGTEEGGKKTAAPTVSQIFKSLSGLSGGFQGFMARVNNLKGLTKAERSTLTSMYNKIYSPVKYT